MLNRGTLYKLRILYPAFLVVFYLTGLFVGRVYYPATAVIVCREPDIFLILRANTGFFFLS